ncbi:MAG TPA: ribonuclease E inhibitor RraB [Luteibacter sp.]|jgi:hypothetical protein|uniref:ribonuclease E inhibitor RraB n=1 Tax=Luteibacter sp. TaxID=1886636 RepID=UPI002F408F30
MNDELMFPDDENGNALRQMLAEGDNLSMPRDFDFTVVFATEEAALQFAVAMLRQGQKASFSEYEEDEEMPWQVTLHPYMDPTHENISLYESALENEASAFEGALEGWGCVPQS